MEQGQTVPNIPFNGTPKLVETVSQKVPVSVPVPDTVNISMNKMLSLNMNSNTTKPLQERRELSDEEMNKKLSFDPVTDLKAIGK